MPADQLSQYLFLLADDESATFRCRDGWDGRILDITIRKHSTDGGRDYAIMETIQFIAHSDASFNLIAQTFHRCLMILREEKPREPFKETP